MHEMQWTFGVSRTAALRLSRGKLSQHLRDFVVCRRVILGRETGNLKITERNAESIRALRSSGESYIVAASHFGREANINLYSSRITPGHILLVTGQRSPHIGTVHTWSRLQYATYIKAFYHAHGGNLTHVIVGLEPSAATLYANLSKPGCVAVIAVDAPWQSEGPHCFARPFAAHRSRGFSLGAIALARLARCAIIRCISWRENDGTIVLDWGDPIKPAPRGTKAEDISIMNKLLEGMEVAIGKRPAQYLLETCGPRRWDPHLERWKDQ